MLKNNAILLHLLEHTKFRSWWHQVLSRMWSKSKSSSLLGRKQNCTATLEDSLAVSYKIKHGPSIWPSNHTPWYWPTVAENWFTQKPDQDGYGSFISNWQNFKAIKMNFSNWREKLLHLDNGILFITKKKQALKSWKHMEEPQMYIS